MARLTVQVNPPSGTITLARPECRNALDREAIAELSQALFDLHQEKRVRGVILAGAGDDFCAGLDLKQLHGISQDEPQQALGQWQDDWVQFKELLEQLLRFPKPLVAAVDGVALGAGFGLCLASDLVVASNSAEFGLPAVHRGMISGLTAPLLHWRVGGKISARLLLTGEPVPAQDALRLHLVDEVVKSEMIWARAHELVGQCARAPAEAIQLSKRLLNETIGEELMTQLSVGAAMGATSCTTEAASEGLSAFVQHRDPNWP